MNPRNFSLLSPGRLFISLLAAVALVGCCASADKKCCAKPTAAVAPAPAPAAPPAPVVPPPAPAPVKPAVAAPVSAVIRINAGASDILTDADGNIWLADGGFEGGDVAAREDNLEIANTKNAALYRTEHWGMESFSQPLPNGKYVVKLHFAETWDGVSGPEGRVFSFNVEGQEFKDFDVWVKAGGGQRAYVETVNATVADGKLDITFEAITDNPAINGIEIIPAP